MFSKFLRVKQSGQALTEYAMLIVVIALVLVILMTLSIVGGWLGQFFTDVASTLS